MRLIYIFLNQGTGFPVGGGSREESNTVDIGGEEALAASSISVHRLRLMTWGCSGIADLGFFWMGLFTGVKEVTGGGNTPNPSVFTMVPLPIGGAPLAFVGGATEATEGTEADVLAGVATGLGPPAPWFKKNNAYGIMGSLSWCFFRTILYKCISVDYILNPLTPPCANFKLIRFSSFASSSLAENDSTDDADLDRSSHIHSFWKGKCTNWHHLSQFGWEK